VVSVKDKLLLPDSTVMDAISAIENSPQRMTIVIDHAGKLLGTITDGDIRRHILRGRSLNEPVVIFMNKDPITASLGVTKSAINFLMLKNNVIGIPIIDKNRYYIETIHLTDVEDFGVKSISSKNVFSCAVIMAGGEGNRLRPITEDIPKPMIKIGKMPLLEYQIKSLAQLGIKRVYIAINYLGEFIEDYFGDGTDFGIEIKYLREDSKLGTAGPLSLLPEIPEKPILVLNGDIYTTSNFQSLYNFHEDSGSVITVGAVDYKVEIPYGIVEVNGEEVQGILEKPTQSYLCNAGIYVISPDVIKSVEKNALTNMTDLVQAFISRGIKVKVFPIYEYWSDIGTPKDLENLRNKLLQIE
jgi:dTDP-glucose pyrophosphorylase